MGYCNRHAATGLPRLLCHVAPLYCRCRDEYEISQPDLHHRKASKAVGARQSVVCTITKVCVFAQKRSGNELALLSGKIKSIKISPPSRAKHKVKQLKQLFILWSVSSVLLNLQG